MGEKVGAVGSAAAANATWMIAGEMPDPDAVRAGADPAAAQRAQKNQPAPSGQTPQGAAREAGLPKKGGMFANQALFVNGSDGPRAISDKDVIQGAVGDCYLAASLAALARTPEGAKVIAGLIRVSRDENGHPNGYLVRFPGQPAILVDASKMVGGMHSKDVDAKTGAKEVWPAVIEQAYAQYMGGRDKIEGGDCVKVMRLLTGKAAESVTLDGSQKCESDIINAIGNPRTPVVFDTPKTLPKPIPFGLIENHSYGPAKLESDVNGKLCVRLNNPHGGPRTQPQLIPFEDFSRVFSQVAIGHIA